jgi:hypothetical protein
MMNEPTNVNTGGGSLNMIGSAIGSNNNVNTLGNISAVVEQIVNKLPDSSLSEEPGIKELLIQLQKAIKEEATLSSEDKTDLLEQVKALAETTQTTEREKKEGIARKAKKIFDATLKSLPATAQIVEASSKLLPIIFKIIGFPYSSS